MPSWLRSYAAGTRPFEVVLALLAVAWVTTAGLGGDQPVVSLAWGAVVVVVAAFARRWPLVALITAFAGLYSVDRIDGGRPLEDVFLLTVIWACFAVGRWAGLRRQPWAAAAVLLLLSSNVLEPGRDVSTADVVFPTVFTAAPWLLGLALQLTTRRAEHAATYADRLASSRHEEIRRATDEERLRIAHELHDVIAHNLSALSLRAQVARRRLEGGGEVGVEDLAALELAARAAMDDLRRVLGVLRPAGAAPEVGPGEGLADLPALLEGCRAFGHDVRYAVRGTPHDLPPALSLVAHRIVQEALTNARRHGARGTTTLHLDWDEHELRIDVRNPVDGDLDATPGHGTRGMEERARLFGGSVQTYVDGDAWVLQARLPTPAPVRSVVS
jgi:signal transduction histidine kinase